MTMKILHVITGLNVGGAEIMLTRLVGALQPPRYAHSVASLTDGGAVAQRLRRRGIVVRSLGMKQGRPSLIALAKLRRLVRNIAPDIVHGWMYHGNLAATMATLGSRTQPPLLWSIRHSLHVLEKEKSSTRFAIRAGTYFSTHPRFIFYNSVTSQHQHEAYGYCRRVSHLIPNGFDTDHFKPDSEMRQAVRAELRVPQNTILIGLVARYDPMKDHANFFRAAACMIEQHPNIHFLLAGRDVTVEHPLFAELMHKSVFRDQVHLLGERDDVPRLTAALDVASSSSLGEAFSNSIAEAMACSVPCVGTDVGDTAKIIGDTGVVVPPHDAGALAAGWQTLISCGRQGREELGQRARQKILERYSLAAVAQQYAQIYARAVETV
jgi:glycosyltransferase involved in cell wall biosynthesis